METLTKKIDKNLLDLERGQTTITLDQAQWQEIKPKVKKIASKVFLRILLKDGKEVRTGGDLYIYESTPMPIYDEPERKNLLHRLNFERTKTEIYIQKIKGSNQLVAFEIEVSEKQDITAFCDPKRLSIMEDLSWKSNPTLLLLIGYLVFLNVLQLAPTLGVTLPDLGFLWGMIHTAFILTIIFSQILSYIRMGHWAVFYETSRTRRLIDINYHKTFNNRTREIINVRRTLDIHRLNIFFSEKAHTTALLTKTDEIAERINDTLNCQIQKITSENLILQSTINEIKTELNISHTSLQMSEKKIRQSFTKGFITRGKLENDPILPKTGMLTNFDLNSPIVKYAVLGVIFLVIGFLFIQFGIPAIASMTFPDFPEVGLFWQVFFMGILILGGLITLAFMFFKAMRPI